MTQSEHHGTRHCPTCNSTDLTIDLEARKWRWTYCKQCGRELQNERFGETMWIDPQWVAASEN